MPTKTITISTFYAATIKDMANNLKGEEALENLAIMLNDTADEHMRGMAVESVLKFYANARVLAGYINDCFNLE